MAGIQRDERGRACARASARLKLAGFPAGVLRGADLDDGTMTGTPQGGGVYYVTYYGSAELLTSSETSGTGLSYITLSGTVVVRASAAITMATNGVLDIGSVYDIDGVDRAPRAQTGCRHGEELSGRKRDRHAQPHCCDVSRSGGFSRPAPTGHSDARLGIVSRQIPA